VLLAKTCITQALTITDCLTAAHSGSSLQVSDDDLILFTADDSQHKRVASGIVLVEDVISDSYDKSAWQLLSPVLFLDVEIVLSLTEFDGDLIPSIWAPYITMTRKLVKEFLGPVARRRRFQSEPLLDYWRAYDTMIDYTATVRTKLHQQTETPQTHFFSVRSIYSLHCTRTRVSLEG